MTGLQGLAGGLFLVLAVLSWVPSAGLEASPARLPLTLTGLLLVAGGGAGSIFHMHHKSAARFVTRRLKTSWLSREVVTTMPFGVLAALSVALPVLVPGSTGALRWVLTATALMALVAMFVTAMIYATIPAMLSWHTPLTVLAMMGTGLVGGGVWAWAGLVVLTGRAETPLGIVLLVALGGLSVVKALQWARFRRFRAHIHAARDMGTPGVRYRLHDTGTSRPPYRTQPQVWPPLPAERRRAMMTALLGTGALTLLLLAVSGSAPVAGFAAVTAVFGVYVERWLFFADATHSSLAWIADGFALGGAGGA